MRLMHTADWIGIMSGTSLDGIDAVRIRLSDDAWHGVIHTSSIKWDPQTRDALLNLQRGALKIDARQWARLDQAVAQHYVAAALPLLDGAVPVHGIGMHGQTVFHDGDGLKTSLQLGNPHLLAAETGCPVVSDFRRADMSLGGQGAPLVPAFHEALFQSDTESRAVLNLGGIANLTLLARDGHTLAGYDVGPGNALLDEWALECIGSPFDEGGRWAASGQCLEALIDTWLSDPWFERAPPKSTGRDYFSLAWLDRISPGWRDHRPEDLQRSLVELTTRPVAAALSGIDRLLVCGGGAYNRSLVDSLQRHCPKAQVQTTDAYGLPPNMVEASAFGWLASRRILSRSGRWHLASGASRAAILGSVSLPAEPGPLGEQDPRV
jgi:anhydro-N-acetylmuramic acid kinase